MMRLGEGGVPQLERDRTETRKETFADTLRRQFRSVMKALTRPKPEPAPKSRRRREDTGRNFSAAQTIFQRVVRFLPLPGLNPEWEPFTWLRIWEHSESVVTDDWLCREPPPSDLSLHP
jgi:hypothetical protein